MESYTQIISLLSLTLGAAWASGINLYATILTLGLLGSFGHVDLPAGLEILENPIVLAAAGIMFFVEFFADKIPGFDSVWDGIHTFIRIPAGAVLATAAVGDVGAPMSFAAALVGGGLSATSHFTKASSRLLVNTSPEPVSNWTASFAEDFLVIAGVWTALNHPYIFLFLLILFLALAIYLLPKIWKGLRLFAGKIASLFSRKKNSEIPRE